MANIRNYISMKDQMTPTLRAILKSMNSTLKAMERLDRMSNNGNLSKEYKRAEKDIKRANNALIKMKNYTDLAGDSAMKASRQYGTLGRSVSSITNGMRALGNSSQFFLQSLASGVYLAEKLGRVINGVMTTADTSRSQVARLGLYNTSQYTNEELYGKVFATAMQTRSGLTETADLANKILISGVYKGSGAAEAAIGTAGIINRALVAGGGTNEENQRAIRQLTQGLASGVLQGDELRSIREQAPYFAQVLAEGLGKVDKQFEGIGIGDLKELGAQGVLTSDKIVKAMWAMQDEVNKDFKQMPKTFGQATTSLSNIWQYFLFLLSGTEGPLGKINNMMWQLVDYLQSPQGFELLEGVAYGIDIIATAITGAMGAIGDFIVFLQDNAPIAQALFIGLGTAIARAGIAAAVSWIAVTWPILLIIGLVGLVAWAFLNAGFTAQQVVGAIVGGILWLGAVIWDIIVFIIAMVWYAIMFIVMGLTVVGAAVILAVQAAVQIIIWAVMIVITILWFIWTVIESVFLLGKAAVQGFVIGVVSLFYGLAQTILGIMGLIAKGIDAVFGSDLHATVETWSGTLEGKYTEFVQKNDPTKTLEEIGDKWNEFGSGVADMFTGDEYNLYGEMGNVWNGTGDLLGSEWDLLMAGDKATMGLLLDPGAAFNSGNQWGMGLVDGVGKLGSGLPGDSVFGMPTDVSINGGDLDSVGSIKSDVNMSDEDIQLLRDMAARDYLLQMQSVTPVAHVTFGDVRETADVNKIIEVIEEMVDEQMATALVS